MRERALVRVRKGESQDDIALDRILSRIWDILDFLNIIQTNIYIGRFIKNIIFIPKSKK